VTTGKDQRVRARADQLVAVRHSRPHPRRESHPIDCWGEKRAGCRNRSLPGLVPLFGGKRLWTVQLKGVKFQHFLSGSAHTLDTFISAAYIWNDLFSTQSGLGTSPGEAIALQKRRDKSRLSWFAQWMCFGMALRTVRSREPSARPLRR
jgi:hypothetical protein